MTSVVTNYCAVTVFLCGEVYVFGSQYPPDTLIVIAHRYDLPSQFEYALKYIAFIIAATKRAGLAALGALLHGTLQVPHT